MDGSFDELAAVPGTSTQATPPATPPNPELRRIFGIQYPDVDFVRRVAKVCDVSQSSMEDVVAKQVADSIRNYLKDVIKEASRFAVHGRRARLIPQDLDDALRMMGVQPLYGMRSTHGEPFRFAGSAGKELVLNDGASYEVELRPIMNAPPPKMPLEPQLKPHWLVIDGVQPAVPENPVPRVPVDILGVGGGLNSSGGSGGREEKGERTDGTGGGSRTLTTHSLSLEQQVYFKEIVESVIGHDADKRNEALHCLQTDRGLQSMAPRFVLTIVEGVRTNIGCRNVHCLQQLLMMTNALMNNRTVNMSRVAHDLLPAILSCCVARRLSARPAIDNHWAVREAAGKLVARMCNATDTGVLRTRVSHLLMQAFEGKKAGGKGKRPAMATLYGACYGLCELGLETVRTLIVPRAAWLHDQCERAKRGEEAGGGGGGGGGERKRPRESAIEDEASQEEVNTQNDEKKAAGKMIELVTGMLIKYVRATRPASLRDLSDYTEQLGGFANDVYKETVTDMPSRPAMPASSSSASSHRPLPPSRGPGPSASLPRPGVMGNTPRARPLPVAGAYGYASGSAPGYRNMSGQQPRPGQYQGQQRYM